MADLTTPMAIRVAATLSLVERAGDAGATADELASGTGTSASLLRRLLERLVTIGAFELDQDGRYRPTSLGAQMGEDAPGGIKVRRGRTRREGGRDPRQFLRPAACREAAAPDGAVVVIEAVGVGTAMDLFTRTAREFRCTKC